MNKIKLLALILLLFLLVSCTTGCTVTYGESEPEKNCYRFVDYSGKECIESTDDLYCGITKGNLHCVDSDYNKRIMVQEYEKIVCPESAGEV